MIGGLFTIWVMRRRRRRHRLDVLHALQQHLQQHLRDGHGGRHLHHRLLVDPHRAEFHRHHAQDARAGADLVSAAAVRLVALRDAASSWCWARRCWRSRCCWSAWSAGLGIGIFDPKLGGDPILFQHLFWFYSHPAVYIMVLPAMGVISELVAAFSRNRIFGYRFVAFASLAIAVLGFLVWGHHMFVSAGKACTPAWCSRSSAC